MAASTLIVVTSVGVVGLFLAAVVRAYGERGYGMAARTAIGVGLWLGVLYGVSQSAVFDRDDLVPPPFAFVLLAIVALGVGLGLSSLGKQLASSTPIPWLVGFHSFRFFAEWMLYAAYLEGLCPPQMTVVGNNKDILTAVAAVLIGAVPRLWRSPVILKAFHVLGLGNLVVIMVTAALSMPSPFRYYLNEPSQVWVVAFPYILLPGILVMAAFAGHVVLIRAQAMRSAPGDAAPARSSVRAGV